MSRLSSEAAAILNSFQQNSSAVPTNTSNQSPPSSRKPANAATARDSHPQLYDNSRPTTARTDGMNDDYDNENAGITVSLLHKYEPVLPRLTSTVLEERERKIYSSRNQVQTLLCSARGIRAPPPALPPSLRSSNPVVAAQQRMYSDFIQEQRNSPITSARGIQDETVLKILSNPTMPPGSARSIEDDVHAPHPTVRKARFPETKYERDSAATRSEITVGSGLRGDIPGLKELAKAVAEEGAPQAPSYVSVGSRFFDGEVAEKKNVIGAPIRFERPEAQRMSPRAATRVQSHQEALYVSSIVLARTREESSRSPILPPVPRNATTMTIPFPKNLQSIINIFVTCAKGERQLSFHDATIALALLDVTDPNVVAAFCGMMDVHQDRSIDFDVLIAVLDTLVNGSDCAHRVRAACFAPFNVANQGYIHRDHLVELRSVAGPDSNAQKDKLTPCMVKQLADAFNILRQLKEEEYILKVVKRGKKKRKVPPLPPLADSFMPSTMMKIEHITFDLFCNFFDQKPEFVIAFAPIWLPLVLKEPHLQKAGVLRSVAAVKMQEELLKNPPPPPPVPPPKKKKKTEPDSKAGSRLMSSVRSAGSK